MADVTKIDRDIEKAEPALKTVLPQFIAEARANGLCVGWFEIRRTRARQNFLKATGQSGVDGDNPRAFHVRGLAADVVFIDYESNWSWSSHWDWRKLHEIAGKYGLNPGGQTFKHELCHFQLSDT
jgi:hypothetical protein